MAEERITLEIYLSYPGTKLTKGFEVTGDESIPVLVNRALQLVSSQVNGMVQVEQSAMNQSSFKDKP